MANLTNLQTSIDALVAQVAATKTVEASATKALQDALQIQADAIKKAVEDDNAIDDVATAAISKKVDDVTAQMIQSAGDLATAVPANTPPAGPVA